MFGVLCPIKTSSGGTSNLLDFYRITVITFRVSNASILGLYYNYHSYCLSTVSCYSTFFLTLQLLNQKQICSWSSKEKLSSPVVYDAVGSQYVAVFNRSQLRLWTENEDNLDKIKKVKVRIP